MLRPTLCFLLLSLLFLSQFGRVLNYALCKVEAYEQTSSFVCDCEKLLYSIHQDNNTGKEMPAANIASNNTLPELYHQHPLQYTSCLPTPMRNQWKTCHPHSMPEGSARDIFRPPIKTA